MSEDDLFDAVGDTVDEFLTPTLRENEDSPGVPSGVSSGSGEPGERTTPSTSSPAVPVPVMPVYAKGKRKGTFEVEVPCPFPNCKKTYKTQQGYDNHMFTHNVDTVKQKPNRRPNIQTLMNAADGLVCTILEEMSHESFSSEIKKKYVNNFLQTRENLFSEWTVFVELLSKPLLEILNKRTRMLPHNQYEQTLVRINALLNDVTFSSKLRDKFITLLSTQEEHDMQAIRLIIYQLCTKLSEEFNLIILKELRKEATPIPTPDEPEDQPTVMSVLERKLFNDKINSIIRNYYSKAVVIKTEVWKVRSECLRQRFMTFVEDTSRGDILKKASWLEGKITVADNVLEFCESLECVIRNFQKDFKNPVIPDTIIKSLLENEHSIITIWHSLATGYFGEMDSLLFMRDFVKIFVNLSVRAAEAKLRREVGDDRLQQCGTREHLKHN